jgi:hypothetical protein
MRLLVKPAIFIRGGRIRDPRQNKIGFDASMRRALFGPAKF